MTPEQDHIFISYAWEDRALADWLGRRLAAEGYAIWLDRLKLLGGEPWPADIDAAIKTRTFRMLAMLSPASLSKPNPTGERTTALALARAWNVPDFMIPLNVTGLRATDLTWTISPISFIPFHPSWASGLHDLLKKLDSVRAPKVLTDGGGVAAASYATVSHRLKTPETLVSNCIRITKIPEVIYQYRSGTGVSRRDWEDFAFLWPSKQASDRLFVSFVPPPESVAKKYRFIPAGGAAWRGLKDINSMPARQVVVQLIHATLDSLLAESGFKFCPIRRCWYLPEGLTEHNRVQYRLPSGEGSWFAGVGHRTFPGTTEPYRYHLSPMLSVLPDGDEPQIIHLRNRLYLTDAKGTPFVGRTATSRRKHVGKTLWNGEWLARTLGILQRLANADGMLIFGSGDQSLIIDARAITVESPFAVDEAGSEDLDEESQEELADQLGNGGDEDETVNE